MFEVWVNDVEFFDELNLKIIKIKPVLLKLEHSLFSISKWESKWHKPFLKETEKTNEEFLDYVRCMTITQNVDPRIYKALPFRTIKEIKAYIEDPMTATWFNDAGGNKKNGRVVTSELVYCWMAQNQIPFECDKWNFNRLLTLIRVCNIENSPRKKMSNGNILKQNKSLNAKR